MKKLLSIMLAVMCVFCSFCFVGCQKTGPIPNGKYAMKLGTDYSYYSEEKNFDNYWEIKGDTATEYVSSAASYKAKIVEKDGVIYFEGYKWKDFFTSIELGLENDYIVEYNAERKSIKTSFIITDAIPNLENIDKKYPEDFAFSLTWNTYGISSYDSQTGLLVKTKDVSEEEKADYQTTYFLTDEEKATIYAIIYDLDMESYPNEYNPNPEEISAPSRTLVLSVRGGYVDKTITASGISYSNTSKSEKGQKFLNAINAIVDILTATDAWKAFPDYPYLYD